MNAGAMLEELGEQRTLLLDNIRRVPGSDANRQYHPDLSPLGWHLGHCLFTELYWVREVLLGDPGCGANLMVVYVPELCPKPERAAALPNPQTLFDWAEEIRDEHESLLPQLLEEDRGERLLKDGFLLPFLSQHYAQHYETTMYILAQRQGETADSDPTLPSPSPRPPSGEAVTVAGGRYDIGAEGNHRPYDNEYPAFTTSLATFHIARRPVCNGEYLGFIENGGYDNPDLWPGEGWRWRQQQGITLPDHWRRDGGGKVYGVDEVGPHELEAEAPVYGVSHYEARAFACWAGARLPHEYEWEAAKKSGALSQDSRVWEWCDNPLHPYAGFEAFPYAGYSVPYFDERHFVLRGGSAHTRPCVRRPSFRNYYEPDKRHIRAGIRLVWP
ncbi:MAG: SUMF1/EgtB/PvdO family nonheme iron enzyme [Gammaproteobacteria bacterium]